MTQSCCKGWLTLFSEEFKNIHMELRSKNNITGSKLPFRPTSPLFPEVIVSQFHSEVEK